MGGEHGGGKGNAVLWGGAWWGVRVMLFCGGSIIGFPVQIFVWTQKVNIF